LDTVIRLGAFFIILVLMMVWEAKAPRRTLRYSRWQRWPVNISLSVITTVLLRFTIGSLAYLAALLIDAEQLGLLNLASLPVWLDVFIALVLFDLAVFSQHMAMHKWPVLWRLHKVHHSDLDFDVTTAVRFHPVEIILSLFYKILIIGLVGAPAIAVLIFEIILSSSALFNHGNVKLPDGWDKTLRHVFVTPDMHRIHHSIHPFETDSNFGFSISLWDRLFGSYTATPKSPHETMKIGLKQYPNSFKVGLWQLLKMPFQSK